MQVGRIEHNWLLNSSLKADINPSCGPVSADYSHFAECRKMGNWLSDKFYLGVGAIDNGK